MSWSVRKRLALAGCVLAGALVPATAGAAPAARPQLQLFAASHTVTVVKYGNGPVYLDLGVYLAARNAPLRLDVRKARYGAPIRVTQRIGGRSVALPAWAARDWSGLEHFFRYTFRRPDGSVTAQRAATFCPDDFGVQRVDPSGPIEPTFPQFCGYNPFTLGEPWGIDRGWAVPLADSAPGIALRVGTYSATIAIAPRYAAVLHIRPAAAKTTLMVHVVKATGCCGGARTAVRRTRLHRLAAPLVAHPSPSTEPDLIALPSWGIGTARVGTHDELDFRATIWDAGPAPMDVEGFRVPGTNTMKAYQFFFRNGKVVGRARAGTLQFDASPSEQEWHFEQFAAYSLLDRARRPVVRSHKVGFCLAPTDPINLLVRGALWQPFFVGLSGACGSATAVWTRETLPTGWGDTYFQSLPEQSLDITHVPNGVYYIKVQANPLGLIHEVRRTNDTRLRKVILGGTPGHRSVRVPAWHGIDPEP